MVDFDTTGQEEITSEPRKTGDLISPTTPNETQEKKKRKPTVLVNGPNHTILDDEGDLEIRNKNYGFGIQISESGDILLLCGSGSGGKNLSGRIIINAPNGQIAKFTGPSLSEYHDDPNSPVEKGSKTSAQSGVGGIAKSDMIYGNWHVELKGGNINMSASNITFTADDLLSLIGGEVLIQGGPKGGGDIKMVAGNISEFSSLKTTAVTSQKMTIGAGEETAMQFDPRASRNLVSAGHMNIKAIGDMKVNTLGVASMHFMGSPVGVPLVKKRTTSLSVGTKLGNIGVSSGVGSITMSAGGAFGDLSGLTPGSLSLKAKVDVKVEGLLIFLN
tara:strand:+ start:2904 stop:3896 length:993 start_codon:yes stop_codon:yes gene_type:complete